MRWRGFALALLGLAACGSDPVLLVDVTLPGGLAPRQLRAYAYPTPLRDHVGLRQQVPALVPGTTHQFALRLLQSTSSQAQVTVQAIASEDGCVAAVGNAQMTVPLGTDPGHYKVQVTLDRLNLHRCDADDRQKMIPSAPMTQVNAITVLPGPVVYAVGNGGQVRRWTPQQGFTRVELGSVQTNLNGVFGFNEDNLWIVGDGGRLLKRQSGGGFAPEDVTGLGSTNLRGIDGSNGEVWVVGEKGIVLWRSGTQWTKLAPTTADLNAVRASTSAVLLAGDSGTVLQGAPGSPAFTAVTGFSGAIDLLAITAQGDKFWLVGAGGQIRTLRSNMVVEQVTSGVSELLRAAWASAGGTVLVAGGKGTLLACTSTCAPWSPRAAELKPRQDLRAIAGLPGQADLWLGGGEERPGEGEGADLLQRTEQP